jgi:hypothetical protein
MIKEGILSTPQPSAVIGQHVSPMADTEKSPFVKGNSWHLWMRSLS